jgi:hypothetical protein
MFSSSYAIHSQRNFQKKGILGPYPPFSRDGNGPKKPKTLPDVAAH